MTSSPLPRAEVYKARRGLIGRTQWRWRYLATNGLTLATSGESYNNLSDAIFSARTVTAGSVSVIKDDGEWLGGPIPPRHP